jgi:SEC-C motif-containing protein
VALCPCGSQITEAECCGRYHRRAAEAPTAEALMRARYSAFVRRDPAYLRHSWHPDTCPEVVDTPDVRWLGLEIRATERGGRLDRSGTVTFAARFRRDGLDDAVVERSTFERLGTRWVYVAGEAVSGSRRPPSA